jgi:hypothetical protein
VAVQEKYLRKGKKLYASQLITIRQRFAYILKAIEADYLRAKVEALESGRASREALAQIEAEYHRRRAEAERMLTAVLRANEPAVVEEESLGAVTSLPARSLPSYEDQEGFPVEGWAEGPFLSREEVDALSIRRGSLSTAERLMIQEHVTETYKFLQKLPWTSDLQRVPDIAWAHHEKLDGSGYPRRLSAPQIPRQSQMMTISDIYDALVAGDRPYKMSVSHDEAVEILTGDARAGRIDRDLLGVFLEAETYRMPAFTGLLRSR